jgi:hypothetical protein
MPSDYIVKAKEEERERIIKLLEQELWVLPDGTLAVGEIYIPLKNAIALIRGENK